MLQQDSPIIAEIRARTGQIVSWTSPKGNLLHLNPSGVLVRVIQARPRVVTGPLRTRTQWTISGIVEAGIVALIWLHGNPPIVLTFPPQSIEVHYATHVTETSVVRRWRNYVGWRALEEAVK